MALEPSNAARSQAYLTRARIGVVLYTRIVLWVLIIWTVLTVYVVWRETGVYFGDHAYFWRWAILSTLVRTPFLSNIALRCYVPANGAWYPVGALVDWMNSAQMYHSPFPTWFLHYGLRTAAIPVGLGGFALFWRLRHMVNVEHLRGLQLLTLR